MAVWQAVAWRSAQEVHALQEMETQCWGHNVGHAAAQDRKLLQIFLHDEVYNALDAHMRRLTNEQEQPRACRSVDSTLT